MIKQIIVIRKDLLDVMGVGKLVAQACHASMKIFFDRMSTGSNTVPVFQLSDDYKQTGDYKRTTIVEKTLTFLQNDPMLYWMENSFTKIVVGCKNLNELLKIEQKAIAAGIPCAKIEDNGSTVFRLDCYECRGLGIIGTSVGSNTFRGTDYKCDKCHGKGTIAVPTITCLALGPDTSEKIDPITKRLRLL